MIIHPQSKRTRLDNTLIHKGLYIFKWSDSKIYNCTVFIGNRKYKIKSSISQKEYTLSDLSLASVRHIHLYDLTE